MSNLRKKINSNKFCNFYKSLILCSVLDVAFYVYNFCKCQILLANQQKIKHFTDEFTEELIKMNNKMKNKKYTMTTTCRTCAYNYENDNLIPIFYTNNKKKKPIDFIGTFCTNNFKLNENDYLPKNICNNCLTNFSILNEFITECEKAEKILKNYFRYTDKNDVVKRINKISAIKECRVRLKRIENKEIISKITENYSNSSMYWKSLTENIIPENIVKIEINNSSEILNEKMLTNKDNLISPDLWNINNDDFKYSSSEDGNHKEIEVLDLNDSKSNRTKCSICQVTFSDINYSKHMKKHQPLILSECTVCKKLVEDLESHNLKKHKIKFICKDCCESFDNRQKFTVHRFRNHEKPQHVCNICHKSYIFLYRLKQHEKICHSNDTNAICDFCGKTFKNPNILAGHRATHIIERKINKNDIDSKQMSSEINTFQCPYCSLKFRNLFGLKNHSKHHKKLKNSETYKHVCEFCSQRFNRSDHLQLHLDLVHFKNLPFTCKYCSKKFPKQYVLNQHVKRRHVETSHICQYCKKEYAFRVSLTRHIRSHHLMENRFKCDICGESFITGIQCKKHMENHTIQEERETVQRIYGEILDARE